MSMSAFARRHAIRS